MGVMSVPSKTLCPRVAKWGYLVFTEGDWSQECYHDNGTIGVILFLL